MGDCLATIHKDLDDGAIKEYSKLEWFPIGQCERGNAMIDERGHAVVDDRSSAENAVPIGATRGRSERDRMMGPVDQVLDRGVPPVHQTPGAGVG